MGCRGGPAAAPGRAAGVLDQQRPGHALRTEEEGFAQERLLRPQRALHRVQWPGGGIEFHPSHGEWIRVLRASRFVIEALHELYTPADGETHEYYGIATAQWASQWPAEDLWAARRTH
jgi:hypothetical protein